LTIYDMVKGAERGVEILNLRLEQKRGGRTGVWRRGGTTPVIDRPPATSNTRR
jgi:cyclic pyranopterin phosphate synthase